MRYTRSLLLSVVLIFSFSACTQKAPLVAQPSPSPEPVVTSEPTVSPTATLSPRIPLETRAPIAPQPTSVAFAITQLPSEYRSDETRPLMSIDTIVLHSLYNPTTPDPFAISNIKKVLDESQVSSHYVIARDGKVYQLVPHEYQAWHAGVSRMPAPDNREKLNLFTLGIELVGNETSGFTTAQYTSLFSLIADLEKKLPIKSIVGHADIAPDRKSDPWKFDWKRLDEYMRTSQSKIKILGSH